MADPNVLQNTRPFLRLKVTNTVLVALIRVNSYWSRLAIFLLTKYAMALVRITGHVRAFLSLLLPTFLIFEIKSVGNIVQF